jgi:hypothetical protein
MTAKKMLVVTLAKTGAVLAAVTRSAPGAALARELLPDGLLLRQRDVLDAEGGLLLPPEDLDVKEVDFSAAVFRNPRGHVLDASGAVTAPQHIVKTMTPSATKVTVTVGSGSVQMPADKPVVVVIDGGPNGPALRFFGKTAFNVAATEVPVSGVPTGTRAIIASVDGFGALLDEHSF